MKLEDIKTNKELIKEVQNLTISALNKKRPIAVTKLNEILKEVIESYCETLKDLGGVHSVLPIIKESLEG